MSRTYGGKVKKNFSNKQIFLEISLIIFSRPSHAHAHGIISYAHARATVTRARAHSIMSRIRSSGMSFIQGYRKVTISLRHVANTRAVKPLRFLAHAQGRFARDRKSIVAVAKSLNSNDMKSQALERCWDQVRLVSTMTSDLRYELSNLEDDLLDIAENCGPIWIVEHDARVAAKTLKKFLKQVKQLEQITDKWANENSPF